MYKIELICSHRTRFSKHYHNNSEMWPVAQLDTKKCQWTRPGESFESFLDIIFSSNMGVYIKY